MFSFVGNLKLFIMEEFRINNYIVDYETEPYYFKIEEIKRNEQGNLACYYRNGSCWSIAPDKVELTEEILLKCGAKYKSIRHREECFINGQCFEFYINNNEISLVYTGGEGVDMSLPIKYLHDLQNIMPFLTNEELTVNL